LGRLVFDGPANETIDEAIARLQVLGQLVSPAQLGMLADPDLRTIGTQVAALLDAGTSAMVKLKELPPKGWFAKVLDLLLGKAKSQGLGGRAIRSLIEPTAMWMLAARSVERSNVSGQNLLDAFAAVIEEAPLPRSLREALRPIFANANFDLAMIRSGIESWYDDVMQRASGWFKRHTTWTLFWVGLIAAVALNVNPFSVVGDLARDPELRTAGVTFAQDVTAQGGAPIVGQQILFAKAAESLKWEDRVNRLAPVAGEATRAPQVSALAASAPNSASDVASSSRTFDAKARQRALTQIATEMQPLLVRSGSFVGLIAASREPMAKSDADRGYEGNERSVYLALVCRALLEDPSRPSKEANENRIALNTYPDTKRWEEGKACSDLHMQFGDTGTPSHDRRVFWKSRDVVWAPDLAGALQQAEVAVAVEVNSPDALRQANQGAADKAIQALAADLGLAKAFAGKSKRLADNFLDRIPSLGWKLGDDPSSALASRAPSLQDRVASALLAFLSAAWGHLGLLGWPLTALMVSFGAPFWFDLMSKLVNRRVTGPKPTDGET
jgi:hypothetical protein